MDCAGGGDSFCEGWRLCPWNFSNRTEPSCPDFSGVKLLKNICAITSHCGALRCRGSLVQSQAGNNIEDGAGLRRGRNAQVSRESCRISSLSVYHAGNALHGHSVRTLLLLGLQFSAHGTLQPSSYGMAASFFPASPFDGNSSKHRRGDLFYRFGGVSAEWLATLLWQMQAAQGGTKLFLQAL